MTYAFAAAGTGGHVYPALSVARALVAAGVPSGEIVFFGGDRMEAETIPAAGFDFVGVDIRGLQRSATVKNLKLPSMVRRARRDIEAEMIERGTTVAIVFGGYVSVPAAWAARRVGADLFVQEQNAVPGLANRLVAGRARQTFVGFPAAAARLARARVTGNPLRAEFEHFDRDALRNRARERYQISGESPVLGVLGGSLGAKILNDITVGIAADADPGSLSIVHLTGRSHLDSVAPIAKRSPHRWATLPYEDAMEYFYAAADVVLSRAGALTISELAVTGTPAVVVPYAMGTAGHQAANATHLSAAGGLVLVPEEERDRVPVEVQQLLLDRSRRQAMAEAALAEGHPAAAPDIANILMEAAGA